MATFTSPILQIFKSHEWYKHDSSKNLEVGRLGWAPHWFAEAKSDYKLLIQEQAPDKSIIYRIGSPSKNSWTKASHPPSYFGKIRLEATEEVSCARSKKRPVLLLGVLDRADDFEPGRVLQRDLHFGDQWLSLPLWSYREGEELFRLYVESLAFDSLFPFIPFAPSKSFTGEKCPDEYCFGRIDLIQPIHSTMIERSEVKVSDEIYKLIWGNICFFVSEKLDPNTPYGMVCYELRNNLKSILPGLKEE
jgi:hypothetical protein